MLVFRCLCSAGNLLYIGCAAGYVFSLGPTPTAEDNKKVDRAEISIVLEVLFIYLTFRFYKVIHLVIVSRFEPNFDIRLHQYRVI